jgi:phage/conjugal plasmid C-4 type zinc finger TraR family protein
VIESTRSSDVADMASDVEQIARDAAVSNRVRYTGVSPMECYQCGDDIEPKRRELLPGTVLCASCAQFNEKKGKRQ